LSILGDATNLNINRLINYNKLMSHNPTSYGVMMNDKGQQIEFFEHPILGDESDIICACHELQLADYTGFYETDDMMAESKVN
jgi:hypothetical protein